MRVLEDEQQLCPCYKDSQEFQQLVVLKDAGLIIYCHRPRKKDIKQAEAVESAVNTTGDVFILHNKKDVKITSSELTSELETKNISCPRCRKTFKHAQKLMQEVKSIDRKIVMGICDHCRKKPTTTAKTIKKPFCACNEIVKKFINVKGDQKEDIKNNVKMWLSKMGHLLKDDITLNKPKQKKTRTYSDLQINRGLNSPASICEPEIQHLFYSGMHKSDINLNTEISETFLKEGHMKQAVAFFQPIEHVETTFAHTPHKTEKINALIPSTSLEDSDTTFVETYVKELPRTSLKDRIQEEVFEDEPSIDAKEALKRRHDLSLRQMMGLEKGSRVPYSVSKKPDIYETPKIAPWAQKEPISKYHVESEVDIKIPKLKHDRGSRGTRDLDYVSNRDVKFRSTRASQESYYEPKKPEKYHHDKIKQGLYDSKEGPKKVKKSDQHVAKSKSWHNKALESKESLRLIKKPQYSFFFPKMMEKEEKEVKVDVSSSHLIKDTQEKFRLQAEREKKKLEEERQKILEQAQKKKLAREEIKLQVEEKKKQSVEDKKYAETQKRQQDKAKTDKTKGDSFDDGEIFSKSEQNGKISKESGVAEKDTKSEPDRIDKEMDKAKKDKKSKPEQGDIIGNILQKAKEILKSKPEKGDKIDEILQKAKKDTKTKPEQGDKIDNILQKAIKDSKSKPGGQGDKTAEVMDKTKKVVKRQSELEAKKSTEKERKEGGKSKDDDLISKAMKEQKKKHETRDKDDDLISKAMKEQKKKHETRDKDDDLISKAMKEQKKKHETRDKDDDLISKAMKEQKKKHETRDKDDDLISKAMKEQKKKHETRDKDDDLISKAMKEQKKKHETRDKDDDLISKAMKEQKKKHETRDKDDDLISKAMKEQKKKHETRDKDDDLISKAMKKQKKKHETRDKDDDLISKAMKEQKKKHETRDKDDDLISKAMKEQKKKHETRDKDDDLISKAMKKQKKKHETRDKDDETTEKDKKDIKGKLEPIKKGSKELKSGIEQRDKISVSEKPKKDLKAKSEQDYKDVEKEQKTKTEKEKRDEKLQREQDKERLKQIEALRKEKQETLKQQATKNREEQLQEIKSSKKKRDSAEKIKSSKKKRDSSEEIKMSMTKIQKSTKKGEKDEYANEQDIFVGKKEEKKGTEGKQKESKVKPTKEEAEFKKLHAILLKEKEEAFKKKKQLENEAKVAKAEKIKSSKKKRDSSEEIKMSMTKIQKSTKKGEKDESANEQDIFVGKKEEKKETEGKQKESKVKPTKEEAEFKKLHAIHLKEKEEAFKKKKQLENEAKVAKALEEAKRKAKPEVLKMCDINIKAGLSVDDFFLRLVRIKQAATMNASDIDFDLLQKHMCHHGIVRINSYCPLCLNSELELDVLSLDKKRNIPEEKITDMIIGEKIFKIKRRLQKTKEPKVVPKLYRRIVFVESDHPPKEIVKIIPQEAESVQKNILSKKDVRQIEIEPAKGILRYALSDRSFIEKGWTKLPTEKVVRKMNVYRMRPAHPEFDWFEHNKNKRLMTYDTGERLAEFDDNGRGRWYYRNGRLALDYYDAEESNAQQRFVIYSSGEPDERGRTHPITILATFDYLGNGIVFDHAGKIRLKYNQTEGVVLDRGIGPVSHWKWHTLNDPPVLQQVMIDTQMAHKDPNILKLGSAADRTIRPDNEEMLAIEFDNFIKEKSKKLSQKFKPFQIKMKALKINEHFSLKVLNQATVYLIFRDGSTNLKLNIGMILDHQEIVDTDTAEVGEVSNSLERFPARTDSLAGLQRSVANAQRYERRHVQRERRLRAAEPCASADQLTAAASPPMRLPLRTVPSRYSSSSGYCSRKPTNNLYYNTRLL